MSFAEGVLELTLSRPATLGSGRLVCIDGPAGSGKTTLASALGAPVVHMDDLYPGWDGLPHIGEQVTGLLWPLAADRSGAYRRYDWIAGAYAERVTVEPAPLLVLEGVASGNRAWSDLITTLVWVQAAPQVRRDRGLERDGPAARDHWVSWMADEERLFAAERTEARADLRLDT